MRILVLVALFLIIPHLTNGSPGSVRMSVNGESSDASDIVFRQELLKQMKEPRAPASENIPCPACRQVREGKLQDLVHVKNESTTCPGDGELPKKDEKSNNSIELK